jgi:hypothetical protein
MADIKDLVLTLPLRLAASAPMMFPDMSELLEVTEIGRVSTATLSYGQASSLSFNPFANEIEIQSISVSEFVNASCGRAAPALAVASACSSVCSSFVGVV